MATLAKLVVQMDMDSSGFAAGMASAKTRLNEFGASARSIGSSLTMAVSLPAIAAAGYVVKAASDMSEAISATKTVFGANGDAMIAWGDTTAKTLGIAKADALTAATQFAAMGKAAGLADSELVPFSQGLVTAAADLSSFWNTPSSQVLEDLRSGLNGQYEPLLKYGMKLSEAVVQQRAMADTGKTAADQLTAGELAAARYALIIEGMGPATGDFARTQEGLANQTRIVQAQFQDAAAALGQQLLPYVTTAVSKISELVGKFGELSPTQQKVILGIVGLAIAIGPAVFIIGTLATAIGFLISPIGLVIAAIALLFLAYQTNFMGFADGVNAAWAKVNEAFDAALPHIQAAADLISGAFTAALPTLTEAFNAVKTNVTETFNAVKTIIEGAAQTIKGVMQVIKGIFTGDWGLIKEGVSNIVKGLVQIVTGQFEYMKAQVKLTITLLKLAIITLWNAIRDYVVEKATAIKDKVVDIFSGMKDTVYNAAYNAGYAIGEGIIAGVNAIWNSIIGFLDSLIAAIWDKVKEIGDIDIPIPNLPGWVPGASSVNRSAVSAAIGGIGMPGIASGSTVGAITINVNGAGDPRAVADQVFEVFAREMALATGAL